MYQTGEINMINYIYCFTNLINDKKYVGQTNNITRRINEHKSNALNVKSVNYNTVFHKAIRKYGIDNFKIDILEVLNDVPQIEVDKKEQYWIREK